MEANTAEQFNINYIRLPKNAKLNRLAFGLQQVIGEIFSFTGKAKGGAELSCYRSYDKFKERCGVSRATVGRALKIGREDGLIKGGHKQGYKCLIEGDNGEFWRLPSWVCTEEFTYQKNCERTRKLKKSERKVYMVLYTQCTNKKNGKHTYDASYADLAEETGLCERTVQRAISVLIWAGLIYRPKENKGVNAYKVSRYSLNYKLVLLKEKREKQIRKELVKEAQKAQEEPFPEFALTEVGNEEFTLHTAPKRLSKRKSHSRKSKLRIDIPEKELFQSGTDEWGLPVYDFANASNEELQNIKKLYTPSWSYLGVLEQGFIMFIEIELNERNGKDPPQVKV